MRRTLLLDRQYAQWNPAAKGASMTVGSRNLYSVCGGGTSSVLATIGKSSGKWYWEYRIDNATDEVVGFANRSHTLTNYCGSTANSWGYYAVGSKVTAGSFTAYGAAYAALDIIGVALDMDNGMCWFSKNGVWQASGNPTAGTNAAFTGLAGTLYPARGSGTSAATAFFGRDRLHYPAPSGFNAGIFT